VVSTDLRNSQQGGAPNLDQKSTSLEPLRPYLKGGIHL
jgi:hypothetical protein